MLKFDTVVQCLRTIEYTYVHDNTAQLKFYVNLGDSKIILACDSAIGFKHIANFLLDYVAIVKWIKVEHLEYDRRLFYGNESGS